MYDHMLCFQNLKAVFTHSSLLRLLGTELENINHEEDSSPKKKKLNKRQVIAEFLNKCYRFLQSKI